MIRKFGVCLVAGIALSGCGGGDQDELRQWMKEETKNFHGRIPPLPQVKPYEPVPYDAGGLVDPFKPTKIQPEQKRGGGLQPDFNRAREPLESFPLESLKYVGSLTRNKQTYGLIHADGSLHQVRTGNYMGQNFGVITNINEMEVTLRELVQDPAGDWAERTSTMLLQAKEGK